nr:MAG TPA: protein of unknown function (DUF934) [Caudoviricetes sp.]
MQGQTLHLHSFSFPPSFPDGRGFGSARRKQYAAGRCHPTFRGAVGRTSRAATKAVDTTVGQWHSAALKVCQHWRFIRALSA